MNPAAKKHFENLDALRFFAFLLVFFSHGFFTLDDENGRQTIVNVATFEHLGRLGVDFFFVLSSFLITWIILEEQQQTGGFNARFFLIRRTLRIWPLYFLIVLLGYTGIYLQQNFGPQSVPHDNPEPWWFIFFIINFYVVLHGDQFLFFLVFLWSIAIEEQFYLVWAFIMKSFRPLLMPICILLVLLSLWFRWMYIDDSRALYFHTISGVGNFGMGALLALFCMRRGKTFQMLSSMPSYGIVAGYAFLVGAICFYNSLFSTPYLIISERLIFSVLFAFVIFEQSFCKHSLSKAGQFKPLNYLGKISYGLYCYHGVVITLLVKVLSKWNAEGAGAIMIGIAAAIFFLTIAASAISYEFFEKRFLRLRTRFY